MTTSNENIVILMHDKSHVGTDVEFLKDPKSSEH